MDGPLAVILAAGKSTRMKSARPKVLHEVFGRPLIGYVLQAAREAGVQRRVVVVGHQAEAVQQALSGEEDIDFVLQEEQLGTGHAVLMAAEQLSAHKGPVLILAGDTPLLRGESLRGLLEDLQTHHAACVVGTAVTDDNAGLGRIVRDDQGNFVRIVEEKDASPEEKTIREVNTGCYAFAAQPLLQALQQLRPENQQSEYYLTDCPALLQAAGETVLASRRFEIQEAQGVNTRAQLAEVHRILQKETQQRLMDRGVTLISPELTWIDPQAGIGRDTVIFPFTSIVGNVRIGENCRIGPQTLLKGPLQLPAGSTVPPGTSLPGKPAAGASAAGTDNHRENPERGEIVESAEGGGGIPTHSQPGD